MNAYFTDFSKFIRCSGCTPTYFFKRLWDKVTMAKHVVVLELFKMADMSDKDKYHMIALIFGI